MDSEVFVASFRLGAREEGTFGYGRVFGVNVAVEEGLGVFLRWCEVVDLHLIVVEVQEELLDIEVVNLGWVCVKVHHHNPLN